MQHNRATALVAGSLLALITTVFAAAFHTLAGGFMPHFFAIFVLTVLTLPLGIFAVARKQHRSAIFFASLIIQALFHWIFVWITPPADTQLFTHQHSSAHFLFEFTALSPTKLSLFMVCAHFFAALFTAAILVYADNALRAVLALAARFWQRVLPVFALQLCETPVLQRVFTAYAATALKQLFFSCYSLRAPPLR